MLLPDLPRIHEAQERQEGLNVLASGLGAELGLAHRDWGDGLWSSRCTALPEHEPANQLTGLTPAHLERLPEIVRWFDAAGTAMHVRWPGPAIDAAPGAALHDLGFRVHELEAWLAAPIAEVDLAAADHDIHPVDGPDRLEDFVAAFVDGWQVTRPIARRVIRAAMARWPTPPRWHRYVAYVDGTPAAEALLVLAGERAYLAEAATVPAFRGRGLQTALIARRARDAAALGATTLFGAVVYGDGSWANMRRRGLREAYLTLRMKRPVAAGALASG